MIGKQRFMALMISASMGLSMLASPVAALAAEEPPAAEEAQDAVTEETTPAAPEAEPAPEEKEEEAAPAEEVQEPEEEAPAETVDAGQAEENEGTEEAAEAADEETDESVPAGAVEETKTVEEAEAAVTEEVPAEEEEIKETSVEAMQGSWEGPGIYSWINTRTNAIVGYRYMYTTTSWHKGFKTIGSSQYYFDSSSGYMKTGWFSVNP